MDGCEESARLFKTLMHSARMEILETLHDDEYCVCHMEAALGYRQAYISQHLAVLREAGLVQDRRVLSHPQDAEDILQETFLKAYRYLPEFDGRSKLSTWLYRIATNEALMFIRRHKTQLVSIDEQAGTDDGEMEPMAIIDWCCLPESELMSSEARAYLDLAIPKMPESLRVVFLLRDIESLSTAETAEALGLSETAVKTRLSRARMHLREELSHYYGERLEGQTYGAS